MLKVPHKQARELGAEMRKILLLVCVVMLLLALAPLPYGYYTMLRLVVCGAFAWTAFDLSQDGRVPAAVTFILGALLFNPLIPVHLNRELWAIINIATAALAGWGAWLARKTPSL